MPRIRTLLTPLYLLFIVAALVIMWGEYAVHCNDPGINGFLGGFVWVFTGQAAKYWPTLALLEGLLGLLFVVVLIISRFKLGKTPLITLLWMGVALGGTLIAQLAGDFLAYGVLAIHQLAFTTGEQLLFNLFCAPIEETAFRGAMLGVSLVIILAVRRHKALAKWIAIIVQAFLFAAIHTSYYNQLPELFAVFATGVYLGWLFFYLVQLPEKRGGDVLLAFLLAHFLINLFMSWSLILVLL